MCSSWNVQVLSDTSLLQSGGTATTKAICEPLLSFQEASRALHRLHGALALGFQSKVGSKWQRLTLSKA